MKFSESKCKCKYAEAVFREGEENYQQQKQQQHILVYNALSFKES